MGINSEEPILSRLDRLNNILRQLEEIRGNLTLSPNSPCASSTSPESATHTSSASVDDFSPRSMEKHCRPMLRVLMEIEHKGSLVERLDQVEDRVLKLCAQWEEELVERRMKEEEKKKKKKRERRKGLKQLLMRSCVKGGT